MDRLALIQLDSVPVIARTQYMPAYSRLGAYDPTLVDDIAYRLDEWFEAYVHEASVMAVADEPLTRFMKIRAEKGWIWKGLKQFGEDEGPYIADVLAEVTDRGPLKAAELSDPRPRSGEWWGSRSMGTVALDYLFRIGRVGIRRDQHFEKSFDLIDRIIPAEIRAQPTPSDDDSMRELLTRAGQALGVATDQELVDYFRLPKRDAKPLIADVVEAGHLVPATVEGLDRPAYLDPDATQARRIDARAFLSPFDPVVWYRPRGEWMFDFEYRIEIYVPKAKRVWGYYVLPFLVGDRLVGRADLKTDRKAGRLRVLAAYAEDHAEPDHVGAEMAAELPVLAATVGVDSVSVDATGPVAAAIAANLA